jgi:hypothetical protein
MGNDHDLFEILERGTTVNNQISWQYVEGMPRIVRLDTPGPSNHVMIIGIEPHKIFIIAGDTSAMGHKPIRLR